MIPPWLEATAPYLIPLILTLVAASASIHAILDRRDVRATIAWVGFIWLIPAFGVLCYTLFGINRIERRAQALNKPAHTAPPQPLDAFACDPSEHLPPSLQPLAQLVSHATHLDLLIGHRVELLRDGDETYPAMLDAIASARTSITFQTYIFDNDPIGQRFAHALADAHQRGVAVRVLIDDVGSRYSWPSAVRLLEHADVPVARFMPTWVPWRWAYMNLRNHRKIMVVDGHIGFTGGLNIRVGHLLREHPKHPIQDLHARLEGPAVAHLQQTFAEDWAFTTGEQLHGPPWFTPPQHHGPVLARGILDGPDDRLNVLRLTLHGALAAAQHRVVIVTPYFIPDTTLSTTLCVTAMRGVDVDIVLPAHGNLRFVQWASRASLWTILSRGCRVWLSPEPFDHSKLMVVDHHWTLLGSANWDDRSLRLNFEFNLECYDTTLAQRAADYAHERITTAQPLTLDDIRQQPRWVRLRNGCARLFSPYL